ncbi:hypothetical protein ACFQ1S_26630, partial [Kibdelosporangium lantanae]
MDGQAAPAVRPGTPAASTAAFVRRCPTRNAVTIPTWSSSGLLMTRPNTSEPMSNMLEHAV